MGPPCWLLFMFLSLFCPICGSSILSLNGWCWFLLPRSLPKLILSVLECPSDLCRMFWILILPTQVLAGFLTPPTSFVSICSSTPSVINQLFLSYLQVSHLIKEKSDFGTAILVEFFEQLIIFQELKILICTRVFPGIKARFNGSLIFCFN